ncbi:hypothetical protein NS226_03765 [Aureimonas ureilytica]|uniref:Uncharacterized protein n=1 Tax=Aureimonas ureilytica TaxID=401562 RepID=A0A175RC86_9HYPH|nr:hypothetical protein [Aureimonas ureilytica]KTQ97768.1 hypothetical protein NS226_03765 [Aureimonas ureilytica]
MSNPYPLSRQKRQTDAFRGDGRATYGPFAFRIWDAVDVVATVKRSGASEFKAETVTAQKTGGEPFDTFTVSFSPALGVGDVAVVKSQRLQERLSDVTRGGTISGAALERELSVIGTVLQELRRDVSGGAVTIGSGDGGGSGGSSAWSAITGKPTTLQGYGISDAYTKDEVDAAIKKGAGSGSGSGTTVTDYGAVTKPTLEIRQLRGTRVENDSYKGASGIFAFDETTKSLRLHDGSKAGGHILNPSRLVNAINFGAVSGADNASALTAARAAAGKRPIYLEGGEWGAASAGSFYGSIYKEALGLSYYLGTAAAPSKEWDPILYMEKIGAAEMQANNVDGQRTWDVSNAYFSHQKVAGSAYTAVISAYGHHAGGTNDLVAVNARMNITTNGTGGRGWAIWAQTTNGNNTQTPWHIAELNGANVGVDPGWDGGAQALRINMTDFSSAGNRMSTALTIGKGVLGGDNGFYTGINIEAGALVSNGNPFDNGEAIRIQAPDQLNRFHGGIRFRPSSGGFRYAIRTDESYFYGNAILLMAYDQVIQWGGIGNKTKITADSAGVRIGSASNGCKLIVHNESGGDAIQVGDYVVLRQRQANVPKITAGSTNNDTKNNVINAIIEAIRRHGLIHSDDLWTT